MTGSLLLPIRHLARLTLEAETPVSIASGAADADIDTPLFRDWNGLPCLAGSGLAGVLRALCADYYGDDEARGLFGWEGAQAGQASRLTVSFGLVHDQTDRAVCRPIDEATIAKDRVLSRLRREEPVRRDHVAIDPDRGAAADTAKFDRAACPRGTRFSLELAIDGAEGSSTDDLEKIVALFSSPYARFGGAGRRGLGRLKVVRADVASVDRRGADGKARWIALRRSAIDDLPTDHGLKWRAPMLALKGDGRRRAVSGVLRLEPKGHWRMGRGTTPWGTGDKPNGAMPLAEPVIRWDGKDDKGPGYVIDKGIAPAPGAGIKGVLAHRAEFHLRRIRGTFGAAHRGVRLMDELFGSMADKGAGRAGAVFIDDAFVTFGEDDRPSTNLRIRNSIDRHTGGVRDGKLFADEAHWKGPVWEVRLTVMGAWTEDQGLLARDVCQALDWAIEDLCSGAVAIGAGDGIGDGVFEKGEANWSGHPSLTAAMDAVRKNRSART